MTTILIVLMLAAAAVAAIVLARKRTPARAEQAETDTAWNDPVGRGGDQNTRSRDDGTR
jgi:hypothetical protein